MPTVLWVDVEVLQGSGATGATGVVVDTVAAVVSTGGGEPIAAAGLFVARFDAAAAAGEAAIVGQWNVQRLEPQPGFKLRVGLHSDESLDRATAGAHALCEAANGNQILMSGAVDILSGGTLDARPMGVAQLPGDGGQTQLWLMTDSRPDVDPRPLRDEHLR